jgi:death-on-curing protein
VNPANDPWIWIDPSVIHAVHEEQLAEHGGSTGGVE